MTNFAAFAQMWIALMKRLTQEVPHLAPPHNLIYGRVTQPFPWQPWLSHYWRCS